MSFSRSARTAVSAAVCSLLGLSFVSLARAQQADDPAQQVVVSALRFPEPVNVQPFGVSVLTAAQIHEAGVSTVNEALMKLLGVPGHVDFYGGGDYALDLRGFGGAAGTNQVVVLDGVRLTEADLSGTRLASIPIDLVDRIEVIHGSAAVLYGEGATGGVIVITTKGAAGKVPRHGDVAIEAGSFRTQSARANASWPVGEAWSLDAAASDRKSDNHRDNFHSTTGAGSVGLQWRDERWHVSTRASHDELDTGLPGGLSLAQYESDPRQTNTPQDHATIRNDMLSLAADTTWLDWQWAVDLGWRRKALDSLSVSSFGAFDYAFDIKADNQSLRARRTASLGGTTSTWSVGLDTAHWQRNVQGGDVATQRTHAVYLKNDVDLHSGTRLSLGVRSEWLRKQLQMSGIGLDDRQTAWEAGVTQTLPAGFIGFARFARSYRLPGPDEFSFTTPGVLLVPQTARDAELGMRWSSDTARAELRAYRSALQHEIGYDPNAVGPFGQGANVNFDPTTREGVEVEGRLQLTRDLGANVNAALRQARFDSGPYDGRRIPLTSRGSAALHLDWRVAPHQTVDAGLRYVSSQHPDFDNVCAIPAYTTADARYSLQWNALEFSLKVDNLADRRYYTQAFQCNAGATGGIYPEAGRAAAMSVRWTFL